MVLAITTAIGSLVGCGIALGFILDGFAGFARMIYSVTRSL